MELKMDMEILLNVGKNDEQCALCRLCVSWTGKLIGVHHRVIQDVVLGQRHRCQQPGRSKHRCWWHEEAVARVAPFGHAVESNGRVFLAGQMPFTYTSINALYPDKIEAQTHAMMAKPTTVLAGCGLGSL
jgi:hypothetical protein